MAETDGATTPRRGQATPQQVSHQTVRAKRAHKAVQWACRARTLMAQYTDRRVNRAVDIAATETARLARMCGSVDAAAHELGLQPDDVRRLIDLHRSRSYTAPPTNRAAPLPKL